MFLLFITLQIQTLTLTRDQFKMREGIKLRRKNNMRIWINHSMRERIKSKGGYDTLRVLALRVEFKEDDDTLTTGNGKMDLKGFLRPYDGLYYDPPHTKLYFERQMEALRNYYYCASGGKLWIDFDVKPDGFFESYQLPHEMKFYGDTSDYNRGMVRLMQDALRVADMDTTIDFSKYDAIIIFHAGSTLQTDIKQNSPFDIPSATITSDALLYYLGRDYIEVDDGVKIRVASILPESPRQDTIIQGYETTAGMFHLLGVLVHEFGHILGLVDLYDVFYEIQGMGAWDIMGSGGWLGDPPGSIPSYPGAWDRVELGWETPVVVTSDTVIKLYAMERDSSRFYIGDSLHPTVVKIPLNEKEYFLIEVRATDIFEKDTVRIRVENGVPVSVDYGEYDFLLPGSGVLIWHIDEDIIEEYRDLNTVNAYFLPHKGVDLEEADGIQDFDIMGSGKYTTYASFGSKYDPFFKGGFNSSFTPYTDPNSNSYYGRSGVYIEVLSEPDTVMEISIKFEDRGHGFPVNLSSVDSFNIPVFYDVDHDGMKEIFVCGTHSLYGFRVNGNPVTNTYRMITLGDSINYKPGIGKVNQRGPNIVITTRKGRIYVLNGEDDFSPKEAEFMEIDEPTYSYPLLLDCDGDGYDEVLMTTYYGKLIKVDLHPGPMVDSISTNSYFLSGPSLFNDTLLIGLSSDNMLYMFDIKNMKVVDGYPITVGEGSNFARFPPVVVKNNDEKYVLLVPGCNSDYRLYVTDSLGTMIFKKDNLKAPLTMPQVCDVNDDGRMDIVLSSKNYIYSFDRYGALNQNYPIKEKESYEVTTVTEILGYLYLVKIMDDFYFTTHPQVMGNRIALGSPEWGVKMYTPNFDSSFSTYGTPTSLGVDDLDGDGIVEIVSLTDSGNVYLWKYKDMEVFPYLSDPHNRNFVEFKEEEKEMDVERRVFVYPNPVRRNGYIRLWTGDENEYTVYIFDITGKLLKKFKIDTEENRWVDIPINRNEFYPGVYMLKVEGKRTRIFYKFGIVE